MPDEAFMVGFAKGTAFMESLSGVPVPFPEVLAHWASVWAEYQAAKNERDSWN